MSLPDVAHFLELLVTGAGAIAGEPSRRELLLSTQTGGIHFPLIEEQHAAIEALPPQLTKQRPVAADLAEKDQAHDAFAEALIATIEAYRALAGRSPKLAAAADRIQALLVPSRSVKTRSYVDTRMQAPSLRESLAVLESDLKLFPVASDDGAVETLYDWAVAYVTAAEELGDLVDLRWTLEAKLQPNERQTAITMRVAAIATITACRDTLRAELAAKPSLPRNLDALIFGPFDDLAGEATPKSPKVKQPVPDPPVSPEV
jgi:hypothetical protein